MIPAKSRHAVEAKIKMPNFDKSPDQSIKLYVQLILMNTQTEFVAGYEVHAYVQKS